MSEELLTEGMDNAGAFDPHEVVVSYEDAKQAIAAALAEKDSVIEAIKQRRAIYVANAADLDPFAQDDSNPHDRARFAVEVLDHLLADLDRAR